MGLDTKKHRHVSGPRRSNGGGCIIHSHLRLTSSWAGAERERSPAYRTTSCPLALVAVILAARHRNCHGWLEYDHCFSRYYVKHSIWSPEWHRERSLTPRSVFVAWKKASIEPRAEETETLNSLRLECEFKRGAARIHRLLRVAATSASPSKKPPTKSYTRTIVLVWRSISWSRRRNFHI